MDLGNLRGFAAAPCGGGQAVQCLQRTQMDRQCLRDVCFAQVIHGPARVERWRVLARERRLASNPFSDRHVFGAEEGNPALWPIPPTHTRHAPYIPRAPRSQPPPPHPSHATMKIKIGRSRRFQSARRAAAQGEKNGRHGLLYALRKAQGKAGGWLEAERRVDRAAPR